LSGLGAKSDIKQKQGESVTIEAQPVSFAVGGIFDFEI